VFVSTSVALILAFIYPNLYSDQGRTVVIPGERDSTSQHMGPPDTSHLSRGPDVT